MLVLSRPLRGDRVPSCGRSRLARRLYRWQLFVVPFLVYLSVRRSDINRAQVFRPNRVSALEFTKRDGCNRGGQILARTRKNPTIALVCQDAFRLLEKFNPLGLCPLFQSRRMCARSRAGPREGAKTRVLIPHVRRLEV